MGDVELGDSRDHRAPVTSSVLVERWLLGTAIVGAPGVRPRVEKVPVDVALSVGSGFGGFQSAMVFRRLAVTPA